MNTIRAIAILALAVGCDDFVGEVKVVRADKTQLVAALRTYRVPTTAMEPTIMRSDEIVVNEAAYRESKPRRGDVIAYRLANNPDVLFAKRVVALPGESVQISRKVLSVDGARLDEAYVVHNDANDYSDTDKPEPFKSRDSFGPFVVPVGQYFVLGDNRDSSMDSRYHGAVDQAHLFGKVVQVRGERGVKDLP